MSTKNFSSLIRGFKKPSTKNFSFTEKFKIRNPKEALKGVSQIRFSKTNTKNLGSVVESFKDSVGNFYKRSTASAPAKRVSKFFKRYATQVSFGFVIAVFLTITVGEGQAFTVSTPRVSAQLELQNNGFVSKSEIVGQTVLTGAIQQVILYEVEEGDSLSTIAERYDTTVGTLIEANNIKTADIEKIKPGAELTIPSVDTNTSLAWLEDLNEYKRDQEVARLQVQRSRSTSLPRIAQSIGGIQILGRYAYSIPTYSAYRGQCTQWVQHKRPDLRRKMGNGGQYLAYARSYGIPTGHIARSGAVVITTESSVGHVAYVESVNWTNRTITVTEENYVGWGNVNKRTFSMDSGVIRGYVY